MYNFVNINIKNKEELKKYITDEQIFLHYFGPYELDKFYNSPLPNRGNDSTPSFRISYYNKELKWRDFGLSPNPQNAIEFVMHLKQLSYSDALNYIYNDAVLNTDYKYEPIVRDYVSEVKRSYSSVSYRNWMYDWEYEYWLNAKISKDELEKYKIYGGKIRHNGIVLHNSKINDPYFIYLFDIDKKIYKGYRPFAPSNELKFYGYNINNHIQGDEFLPLSGDYLIITKSYKDVIVWNKLGYPAVAPHSESLFIPEEILNNYKQRFKNIYVNFDNDETGIKQSIRFTTIHNLYYYNIPNCIGCKDPFEYVIKNNYHSLKESFLKKVDENNCKSNDFN